MNRYAALSPLPESLNRLNELAVDLWWSWHAEARSVFRRLDYTLWRATAHNPVRMLWLIPRAKIEAAARDPEFVRLYDRAIAGLDAARAARTACFTRKLSKITWRTRSCDWKLFNASGLFRRLTSKFCSLNWR